MLSCERRSSAMGISLAVGDRGIDQRVFQRIGVEFSQRQVIAFAGQCHGDGTAEACRRSGYESGARLTHFPSLTLR